MKFFDAITVECTFRKQSGGTPAEAIMTPVSANWKALQAQLKGKQPPVEETKSSESKELWFEVDERDLLRSRQESAQSPASLQALFPPVMRKDAEKKIGKYIAIDCEYVGVGPEGADSALARLTLVNWEGAVLYDTFVRPPLPITDYRTAVSGVRPQNLATAPTHSAALAGLSLYIKTDTVLVGHGLRKDLSVMMYSHPRRLIRDTSCYQPFKKLTGGSTPSLKRLAKELLGVDIQKGEHDSAEDARAAMLLYRRYKDEWENHRFRQNGKKANSE